MTLCHFHASCFSNFVLVKATQSSFSPVSFIVWSSQCIVPCEVLFYCYLLSFCFALSCVLLCGFNLLKSSFVRLRLSSVHSSWHFLLLHVCCAETNRQKCPNVFLLCPRRAWPCNCYLQLYFDLSSCPFQHFRQFLLLFLNSCPERIILLWYNAEIWVNLHLFSIHFLMSNHYWVQHHLHDPLKIRKNWYSKHLILNHFYYSGKNKIRKLFNRGQLISF